jgi:hypothetical protein
MKYLSFRERNITRGTRKKRKRKKKEEREKGNMES